MTPDATVHQMARALAVYIAATRNQNGPISDMLNEAKVIQEYIIEGKKGK